MKQPNIILILADDMGFWAMRNAGNTDIRTPGLTAHTISFQNYTAL